jgi:two-component system KDP operon response regulator KdpE
MAASSQYLRLQAAGGSLTHTEERERPRLLVVHDPQWDADTVGASLELAGYNLYPAATGQDGLRKFQIARPDLILLELRLPDMDGKQVLRSLREWTNVPIIVLSERREEAEKISCLDNGADDYITKPFMMGELLARLRAALRRAFGIPRNEVFTAGCLTVDFERREVFIGARKVILTATEYDLLKALVSHAGRVRTHHRLIHEIWGTAQYSDAVHLLRVTMSNLRRKLLPESGTFRPIVTEAGVGYRLQLLSERTATRDLS